MFYSTQMYFNPNQPVILVSLTKVALQLPAPLPSDWWHVPSPHHTHCHLKPRLDQAHSR